MTATGEHLYKKLFKKEPELSEWERLVQEHTTVEHGYGILQSAALIEKSKIFEKVVVWNRSKPISVNKNSGLSFVPDIICVDKNGMKTYMEYELGHYSVTEFNAKCHRSLMATGRINIIAKNTDTAKKIAEKVKNYALGKGNSQEIRHQMIRITTVKYLEDMDLRKDEHWMYTYRPFVDNEPKKQF